MLNSQSPIPLYHQLADILLERIRSGEYPDSSRIPSEHDLAATYRIGRPTVRQAIDLLVRRGLLKRKRGSGTFVCSNKQEVGLFSLDGTLSAFHKKGLAVTTRILHKMRLTTVAKDPENPFAGGKAYYFSRLTQVDEIPVLIEDMYLHPDLFKSIDTVDLTSRSLSDVAAERYFLQPNGGRQNFRIGYPDGNTARHLSVTRTTPILEVHRFLNFPPADNAFFSALCCRTDRFVFSQVIGGNTYG
jgi:GntR family transcriptional regulator